MSAIDPVRLSKTMTFLLRHRPERGGLHPDDEGWVEVEDLARGVSKVLGADISPATLRHLVETAEVRRFDVDRGRIRARGRGGGRGRVPDILYHATTTRRADRARAQGSLTLGPRHSVYLSQTESEAWRVAHRLQGEPQVLYIDASRARRRGVRFHANRRNGLFMARSIPVAHILNLQPRFAEQLSAGGIPVLPGDDGQPRVALVRVTRRSGTTWEVAKGKLEPGEVPEVTAVREVQEEMGVSCDLAITRYLGDIRYGFLAPGGLPRLKTVYLYLMRPEGDLGRFTPAEAEGIEEVRWFTPDEACRRVTHTSLVPMIHHARRVLTSSR